MGLLVTLLVIDATLELTLMDEALVEIGFGVGVVLTILVLAEVRLVGLEELEVLDGVNVLVKVLLATVLLKSSHEQSSSSSSEAEVEAEGGGNADVLAITSVVKEATLGLFIVGVVLVSSQSVDMTLAAGVTVMV